MAKLEDKVNEILGIESIPEATQPKEFQPPVERPKGDVEVKTEKGKQSPKQIEFEEMVKNLNQDYHLVRSLESFKKIITEYL